MKKAWYSYLWIASVVYLLLGFVHILFAWLGLLCFILPLLIAGVNGNKGYCHKYCGRGQLFEKLGSKMHLSRDDSMPAWMRSLWFRYGFLLFFLVMFLQMLYMTYLVFTSSAQATDSVKVLWTIHISWPVWFDTSYIPAWVMQFSYGFYSVMLTSTILGIVTMLLYKPRSWCIYCPMGVMTKLVCKVKNR